MCGAGCTNPDTASWQRHASTAELAAWIESGDLAPDTTDALVLVLACDEHRVAPALATQIHQPDCDAPPSSGTPDYRCGCAPDDPHLDRVDAAAAAS